MVYNLSLIKKFFSNTSHCYFIYTLSFSSLHLLSLPLCELFLQDSTIRQVALHLFSTIIVAPIFQDFAFSQISLIQILFSLQVCPCCGTFAQELQHSITNATDLDVNPSLVTFSTQYTTLYSVCTNQFPQNNDSSIPTDAQF